MIQIHIYSSKQEQQTGEHGPQMLIEAVTLFQSKTKQSAPFTLLLLHFHILTFLHVKHHQAKNPNHLYHSCNSPTTNYSPPLQTNIQCQPPALTNPFSLCLLVRPKAGVFLSGLLRSTRCAWCYFLLCALDAGPGHEVGDRTKGRGGDWTRAGDSMSA